MAQATKHPQVSIARLDHGHGIPLPAYQTAQAAGLDLAAAVDEAGSLLIAPGERVLVPTGFAMQLPDGYEAQVRPRSGLALKHGISVLNAPGTIDADYRGEIKVLLINLGGEPFEVRRGTRIAQLIIQPVARADLIEVEALEESSRGPGGFGSTGTG